MAIESALILIGIISFALVIMRVLVGMCNVIGAGYTAF
uniref:Uncharacterized protein n=1 Tax=viral metagenome TaxID=1070528 RepID=A0A6C0EPN2_9ZZZZ